MIRQFPLFDLKRIMKLLDEAENAYREEAEKMDDIQRLYYTAVARGVSMSKLKIKEYMKRTYNIREL